MKKEMLDELLHEFNAAIDSMTVEELRSVCAVGEDCDDLGPTFEEFFGEDYFGYPCDTAIFTDVECDILSGFSNDIEYPYAA